MVVEDAVPWADYVVGLPLTGRYHGFSGRLRPYHQSSHLGDEYLLRDDPVERENLSFESLELILSGELGPLRLYGGGEYLFRREPDTLEDLLAHGGGEIRIGRQSDRAARLGSGIERAGRGGIRSVAGAWAPAEAVERLAGIL